MDFKKNDAVARRRRRSLSDGPCRGTPIDTDKYKSLRQIQIVAANTNIRMRLRSKAASAEGPIGSENIEIKPPSHPVITSMPPCLTKDKLCKSPSESTICSMSRSALQGAVLRRI